MYVMFHKKHAMSITGMPISTLKMLGIVTFEDDSSVQVDLDKIAEYQETFDAIRNDSTGFTASMYDVDLNELPSVSNTVVLTSEEFDAATTIANNANLPQLAKGTQIYGYKVAIDKPKTKTTKAAKYPVQQKSKRSIYKDNK